jgi:copper-binding protein NosD
MVVAIAAVLATWTPSPAFATHIGCGATVTQDTTLDSDLVDCPGNGVEIAGHGVTLDLGGHLIDGNGLGAFGVVTAPGTSGVTVENGRVRQFRFGVEIDGVGPSTVSDLELSEGHDGLAFSVKGGLVQHVLAWGNDAAGIKLSGSHDVLVTSSVMIGNASGLGGSNIIHSRIERTVFAGNTFHGVRLAGLTDSELDGNWLLGNGTFGLRIEEGSAGNVLSHNHVNGSGGDGIALSEDSGAARLTHNRSDRNGGDGFDLAGPGAVLVRNHAVKNAGLGFDAPLGVAFDLHNIGRHNGDARQCVGVTCDRR